MTTSPSTASPAPALLDEWLRTRSQADGFVCISEPRNFLHDENQYDAQYANVAANLGAGRGVVTVLREAGADFSGPALEIGCGTGVASTGLVAEQAFPLILLTDPSPAFLRIARSKIAQQNLDASRVCYGLLNAEEIGLLPTGLFSLVLLRSTLHHVLEVKKFIRDAALCLVPGGVLLFQEPCQEGYVLMGALVQFLPLAAERAGSPLTREQQERVEQFVSAMSYYARRDLDKSESEDKHLFRVDELMQCGAANGLSVDFHPNMTFDHYASPPAQRPAAHRFRPFLFDYAKYCMSWDEELVRLLEKYIGPFCDFVEGLKGAGSAPYLHGVFVCRKI